MLKNKYLAVDDMVNRYWMLDTGYRMILNYRIKPEVKITEKEDTEGYQNVMPTASKNNSVYLVI